MGSGGYGSRTDYWAKLDAAVLDTERKAAEAEVEQVVGEALSRINQIDAEGLNTHKDTVLAALEDHFAGVYDLRGGGSRTRGTYVSALSDVDLLLDLGSFDACDIPDKANSGALLQAMKGRLEQRLPRTEISAGRMAVTIRFSDGLELQILPAFREHDGYRIPDPQGAGGWTTTRPRRFVELLQERNTEMGGGLRRTIKLAKLISSNQGIDVRSYHLENIAVKAFENYTGPSTTPARLEHLFNRAKEAVLTPMPDVTGQDTHVDRYLTDTSQRQTLARKLDAAERAISRAQGSPEGWRALLE